MLKPFLSGSNTKYRYRTNVSPIYLILFVSATYYLNRPCLYCSLLLTILVISLYDFRSDWFEGRDSTLSDAYLDAQHPQRSDSLQEAAFETASVAASALNSTMVSMAQSALNGFKRRSTVEEQSTISGAQWLKELFGKKEWRIPCIDVAIRL